MSRQPNILLIGVEDLGWSDVGWYNHAGAPTPYLDSLAELGVKFNRYYAHSTSTPSRASLLSGKYAVNTGLTWELPLGSPAGLPDGVTTIAEALLAQEYSTAMAGVWDLGHSQWKLTPTKKGFEEHIGSLNRGADDVSKAHYGAPWSELGLDWVHSFANETHTHFAEPRPAVKAIGEDSSRMITSHVEQHGEKPLFLYVSFPGVVNPAPDSIERCKHFAHHLRRSHCATLVQIDAAVKAIVDSAVNFLGEHTVLILTSLNGGSGWHGSVNYPFRGGKGSALEGGVHVPAFAVDFSADRSYFGSGGWTYSGLTHISDWFPTMLSLAKGSMVRYTASGGNGFDMTVTLRYYRNRRAHREDALIEMHTEDEALQNAESVVMMSQDMKLIMGHIRDATVYSEPSYFSLNLDNSSFVLYLIEKIIGSVGFFCGGASRYEPLKTVLLNRLVVPRLRRPEGIYLYNVTEDPLEVQNIAENYSDVVQEMRDKIKKIKRERPFPQQQYSMQYDLTSAMSRTLVSGNCSMNPSIREDGGCKFLNPWIRDHSDPWDAMLANSYLSGDKILRNGILGLCSTVIVVLVSMLCFLVLKRNRKSPPKPRPKQ